MPTPARRLMSRVVGWLADRRIPTKLRAPVYGTYARAFGVNVDEAQLSLDGYASLGAFFVRRLKSGARAFPSDPGVLPSPADGLVQSVDRIERGRLLQAKGRWYGVDELLAGTAGDVALEGGHAWTVYLSPRDYHRVHAPLAGRLEEVRWLPGGRYSVNPKVLLTRERVLATNERAVLRFSSERGPWFLVMVGATNVGRIRVVGVQPGASTPTEHAAQFARGEELARFEMGSTVVLVCPPGTWTPLEHPAPGEHVRMGEAIGRWGSG